MPESFWDTTKNEVKGADFGKAFNDLSAFKAEQDVLAASVPKDPSEYKLTLPEQFKAPQGLTMEWDESDPLLGSLRQFAQKSGFNQSKFSEALELYASSKFGEKQRAMALSNANKEKLGTAGAQRVDQIATWLTAHGGPTAPQVIETLRTFPAWPVVELYENLMMKQSNQGGSNFSQQHREGQQEQNKIPGYDKMTFEQRRGAQLSQQMNQRAAAGR